MKGKPSGWWGAGYLQHRPNGNHRQKDKHAGAKGKKTAQKLWSGGMGGPGAGLGERLRLTGGAHSPAGVKAGLCPRGWKPDTLMCLSLRSESCLCSPFRRRSHVSPRSACGKHEEGRGSGSVCGEEEGRSLANTTKKHNRPVCMRVSPPDVSRASGEWGWGWGGQRRCQQGTRATTDWMSLYIQSSLGTRVSCPLKATINNWRQTEVLYIICKTCF